VKLPSFTQGVNGEPEQHSAFHPKWERDTSREMSSRYLASSALPFAKNTQGSI
jgi:hypothetical protein